jgi:hypothetical protein
MGTGELFWKSKAVDETNDLRTSLRSSPSREDRASSGRGCRAQDWPCPPRISQLVTLVGGVQATRSRCPCMAEAHTRFQSSFSKSTARSGDVEMSPAETVINEL